MTIDFWWGALLGVLAVLVIEVVGTFVVLLFLRGAIVMDGRQYTLDEDEQ